MNDYGPEYLLHRSAIIPAKLLIAASSMLLAVGVLVAQSSSPAQSLPSPTSQPTQPHVAEWKLGGPPYFADTAWLHLDKLQTDRKAGHVCGYQPKPNRIEIRAENVQQFSMDTGALDLNWAKRVWVQINNESFQLTHKEDPLVRLYQTPLGVWEVAGD